MRSQILIVGIFILMVAAVSTFSNNSQVAQPTREQQHTQQEKMAELENRLPVADYNEPDPTDPKILKVRREKGSKYDKPEVTVDPYSELVVGSPHWASGLSAFPIKQSTVIVVGTVTGAQARMSNNKKGVYSEFALQIEDVLKNDGDLNVGESVSLDREGGRVRLPSGKVGIYYISGQGMPGIGRRYVLFLNGNKSAGFTVITGYELREGKISPLDNPGIGHPFTKYDGADEQSFLEELRAAIASPLESW